MEGPEIDSHIYSQPIFDKVSKIHNKERVPSIDSVGKIGNPYAKE